MSRFFLPAAILLAILFGSIFAPRNLAAEEKPLYPDTSYIAKDDNALVGLFYLLENGGHISIESFETSLGLPDFIDREAGWDMMQVTDGELLEYAIRLKLKKEIPVSELEKPAFVNAFKNHLLFNSNFGETGFEVRLEGGYLYFFSPNITFSQLKKIEPEKIWAAMRKNYALAIRAHSPENTFFPSGQLPPEKPDEGKFIKGIRKKSKDGKFQADNVESCVFGSRWEEDGEIVLELELTHPETAPEIIGAKETRKGFGLGGFVRSEKDTTNFGAVRITMNTLDMFDFTFRFSVDYLPVAEMAKSDSRYTIKCMVGLCAKDFYEKTDGIRKENLLLFTHKIEKPVQPDESGFPDISDLCPPETLNKVNVDVLNAVAAWYENVIEGCKDWNLEQPVEIAWVLEGEYLYFAAEVPAGGKQIDWNSLGKVKEAIIAAMIASDNPNNKERSPNGQEKLEGIQVNFTKLGAENGIEYYGGELNMPLYEMRCPFISGHGERLLCVAIPAYFVIKQLSDEKIEADENKWQEERKKLEELALANLKSRVARSEKLRDSFPVPEEMFSLRYPGLDCRINTKFEGRTEKYTLNFNRDSAGMVFALASMLKDSIKDFLPDVLK